MSRLHNSTYRRNLQISVRQNKGKKAANQETTKNNEERMKPDRSSAIALHVVETTRHADFDKPAILSKNWPIYRGRINVEQS